MWVRLNVIKYIDERGRAVTHYPGEWVNVGRQQAESWVVCGDASRPDMPDWDVLPGCGVSKVGEARYPLRGLDQTASSEPTLTYPKTLVWSGVPFRQDLVAVGFNLLDTWELVIPLVEYETLATDVGTQVERDATRSIIRDLRVPVYDTRLMFVRRCATTRQLFNVWNKNGGSDQLGFLCALYQVKPLILALPTTWVIA